MKYVAIAILIATGSLALVETCHAQDQSGFEDEDLRDAHRGLQLATAGSMLVTGTLGTILAMNRPTLFGDGRCAEGDPIFGAYGCRGLSVLHGISAVLSVVLYTTTTTIEFAEGTWPGSGGHNTGYKVASGIHLGAMAILPLAGIVAAVPAVFGLPEGDFQRVLRTVHLFVGYLGVGTYVSTVALDL
jgi:hypothetical protein